MPKVKYIPCLFEDRVYQFDSRNLNVYSILHSLLDRYPEVRANPASIIVRVNGKRIIQAQWRVPIGKDDHVIIIQEIGFEAIVGIFGGAVTVGGALGISAGTVTTIAVLGDLALTLASIIYTICSQPSQPSTKGITGPNTYDWNGASLQAQPSIPMPILYGENMIGGNIINFYITTDGEFNYLNMMIGLCEGPIAGIMKEDLSGLCSSPSDAPYIKLNDNFLSNFRNVSWDYRLGTDIQNPIPGYDSTIQSFSAGSPTIDNTGFIYTTVGISVQAFELRFRIPAIYIQWHGDYYPNQVLYHVYHRVHGASSWIDDGQQNITAASMNAVRRVYRLDGLSPNQYDIKVVLDSAVSIVPAIVGDLILDYVNEIQYEGFQSYPWTAMIAITILASEQLSGQTPNVVTRVRGRTVKNLKTGVTEWSQNPIYCVNDLLVNQRYGLGRFITQTNINNDKMIEMADHCDQIIGDGNSYLTSSVDAGSLTATNYVFLSSDIGRWICSNSPNDSTVYTKMLITSINGSTAYGAAGWDNGTPATADGWEFGQPRYQLDIVLDQATNALEGLSQVCGSFRATPIWIRDSIEILIDKRTPASYLMNMGSIIDKSYSHFFLSEKAKPNSIEIDFADRTLEYNRETISVEDHAAINTGAPRKVKKLNLFGASRQSQIYREGRYHLLSAKLENEQIQFRAGIDSIHCLPGEIIKIQHDVPQWGYGARIVSATLSMITLDQEVVISAGMTYVVTVRQKKMDGTDFLETVTVTNSPGRYQTLSVTPNFSLVPDPWGLYAFGPQTAEARPFRIVSLSRTPQFEVEVLAAAYDDNARIDTDVILPEVQYSDLPNGVTALQVTDLAATEIGRTLGDGTWVPAIEISFVIPTDNAMLGWDHAEVYLSLATNSWEYYGKTAKQESFKIENHPFLAVGNTIYIKVVSVTKNGIRVNFDDAPYVSILILGKTLPPSDIDSFTAAQYSDKIILSWTPSTDKDARCYEIREGTSWDVSQVIASNVYGSSFTWYTFSPGIMNLLIKTIDTSGNYSENPAQCQINIVIQPVGLPLATQNGLSNPSNFTNTLLQRRFSSIYDRAIGLLPTQGWDDGGTWDDGSQWDIPMAASGSFTTSILDLGAPQSVYFTINDNYVQDGSSQTSGIQINTSADGVTWSGFATFIESQKYYCRYAQFMVSLGTGNTNQNIFCVRFDISVTSAEAPMGEGHINIPAWAYDSAPGGAWANFTDTNQIGAAYLKNTSNANSDQVKFKGTLAAGIYTIKILGITGPGFGKTDVLIDGVSAGSLDWYSSGLTYNVIGILTGIIVSSSGLKTIAVAVDGKNGSSSGYTVEITALDLYRTT